MKKAINNAVKVSKDATINSSKKIFDITNNKKTVAGVTVFVLVKLFGSKIPFITQNQLIIDQGIEYLLELGLGHKLIKVAWPFVKSKYKYITRKFKRRNRGHLGE